MKIAVITSTFPTSTRDPRPAFVRELSLHLHRLGAEVFVLTPYVAKGPLEVNWQGLRICRFRYTPYGIPPLLGHDGAGLGANIQASLLAKLQFPGFFLAEVAAIRRLIVREHIQVINSHWLIPQSLAVAASRSISIKIPHMATVHAADIFTLQRMKGGQALLKYIEKQSDHIFAVSSLYIKIFKEMIGSINKIEVLPMGIDTDKFKPGKKPIEMLDKFKLKDKTCVLFVGRMEEKKGLFVLIDAWRKVVEIDTGLILLLAGFGTLESAIRRKVIENCLQNHVVFCGPIPNNEIPDLYRLADALVCPSIITAKGETEGMPVVILEALATGLPIVASRVSGIPDVIKDKEQGFLVLPGDSESLAKALLKLRSPDLRNDLGANALKISKKYSWQIIARRYLSKAEQLIKRPAYNACS